MGSVWKRLQRAGKRAAKVRYEARLEELLVEGGGGWTPDILTVVWSRRHRRVCSKPRRWQPGIQNPQRGMVVWVVPETLEVVVTLYRDPQAATFDDKSWNFLVVNESRGRRSVLAAAPLELARLAGLGDTALALPLRPRSRRVSAATLRLRLRGLVLAEGHPTDEDMQSVTSLSPPGDVADLGDFESDPEDEGGGALRAGGAPPAPRAPPRRCPPPILGARRDPPEAGGASEPPPEMAAGPPGGRGALLAWCQGVTAGYRGVAVTDFGGSWSSGLGFCALLHRLRPREIDFEALDPRDHRGNNKRAFDAFAALGVPRLLDPSDMETPDSLGVMTFLSQVRALLGTPPGTPPQPRSDVTEGEPRVSPPEPRSGSSEEGKPPEPRSDVIEEGKPPEPRSDVIEEGKPPEPRSDVIEEGKTPEPRSDVIEEENPPEPRSDVIEEGNPPEPRSDVIEGEPRTTPPGTPPEPGSDVIEEENPPEPRSDVTERDPRMSPPPPPSGSSEEEPQEPPRDPQTPPEPPAGTPPEPQIRLTEGGPPETPPEPPQLGPTEGGAAPDPQTGPVEEGGRPQDPQLRPPRDPQQETLQGEPPRNDPREGEPPQLGPVAGGLPPAPPPALGVPPRSPRPAAVGRGLPTPPPRSRSLSRPRDPPPQGDVGDPPVSPPPPESPSKTPEEESGGQWVVAELVALEQEQARLDAQAPELERELRALMASGADPAREERLLRAWFSLVQQRNLLVRRQDQLQLLAQERDLERRFELLSRELRGLLGTEEWQKAPGQRQREQLLLEELVALVDRRDRLVRDRHRRESRALEEDEELARSLEPRRRRFGRRETCGIC